MPTLIRLGHRALNLDQVCEIFDYGDRIRVYYAVQSSDISGLPQLAFAEFDGAASETFRDWLDGEALDLEALPPPRKRAKPAAKRPAAKRPAAKRPAAKRPAAGKRAA